MVRMRQRRLSARLGDRSRFYKAAASPAGLSSRVSVRVSSLGSSVASRQTKTKGSQRGETNRKACQGTSSSASELSHLRHRCRRSRDGLPLRSSWFLCVFFKPPTLTHSVSLLLLLLHLLPVFLHRPASASGFRFLPSPPLRRPHPFLLF